MKKILLLLFVVFGAILHSNGQRKIVGYEYWFNNSYSTKTNVAVTPIVKLNLSSTIGTNSLNNGLHIFNIRFRDDSSKYSSVISQFFYKGSTSSATTNSMNSYEYWFDNNYVNKVTGTITGQLSNVVSSISTTSLNNGLHVYNIRFKDANGLWSSTVSQFFYKMNTVTSTTANMSTYEYWFDNDYATKISGNLNGQVVDNYITAISTASLTNGLHVYNIRFKDSNGLWSSTVSQFFYKGNQTTSTTALMQAYEYWFDNDYSNKISGNLTNQNVETFVSAINTSAITHGLHTINIRFKDNQNLWSSTVSQFFVKVSADNGISATIAEYEYWFDNDYNAKVVTSAGNVAVLDLVQNIPTSSIPTGLHTFNIRFKDTQNLYSSTVSQFIYKASENVINSNKITTYRYWADDDFNDVNTVNLSIPVNPLDLITQVDLTNIGKGERVIHFQFKDSLNLWSSVTSDTIIKNSLPIAKFVANKTEVCAGDTVFFTNKSIDGDKYVWDFGGGITSTEKNPYFVYTQVGEFSVSLETQDTLTLVDTATTYTNYITVFSQPDADFTYTVNELIVDFDNNSNNSTNYKWDFGDGIFSTDSNPSHTYSANGTYIVKLINYNPCGSDTIIKTLGLYPNAVENKVEDIFSIKVFPNPASDFVNISINTEKENRFFIKILDNTLKNIADLNYFDLAEGSHNLYVNTQDLPNGIYFLHIYRDKISYGITKLVIAK